MQKDQELQMSLVPAYDRLTVWQLFCFGALSAPIAMAGLALVTFIPTYYAADLGLGLGLVGFIFVCGRLLDVVTDPLIGHYSDETKSRIGPRKPWMLIGTPGFCLAVWLLFLPPADVGLLYLALASGFYFLFYTVLDVPYSAVGLEISPFVHERSILASVKALFQVLGAITAAFIPFALAISTGASLVFIAKLVLGLSGLGLGLFWLFVPNRDRRISAPRLGIRQAVKLTWASDTYRPLLLAFFIVQSANALTAGLTVLFITHVIGAPQLIGMFLGLLLLSSAVFLPLWFWASKKFNKRKAWSIAIIICICVLLFTAFLQTGDVVPAIVLSVVIGAAFGCDAIMPTSMLADIVYADEKNGQSRLAGIYLAQKNSVSKLSFIAPMGLAFPVLDMVGFDTAGSNEPNALFWLIFFYAGLPIALRIITLFIVQTIPLTTLEQAVLNG